MKRFLFFLMLCSSIFSLDKYRQDEILSVWKVNYNKMELLDYKEKDGLGILNSQKRQKELWDIILNFYPKEVVEKIEIFIVFADNRQDNDGGMFGLIEANNKINSKFIFSLDIQDAYTNGTLDLNVLLPLLTHEFFHIISLDQTQLSPEDTGGLRIFEGYARRDSYLNGFYERFWTNPLAKRLEFLERDTSLSYREKKNLRDEYFIKNSDKFVNSYGMTNVVEDIAVSFEEYVRLNKNHFRDSLKYEKIDFFNSYPKLIAYKKHFLEKRRELLKKDKF